MCFSIVEHDAEVNPSVSTGSVRSVPGRASSLQEFGHRRAARRFLVQLDMSDIDLVELDATALAHQVRTRHLSARRLTASSLRRITELDPSLNAFRIVMGESALAAADRIDALPDDELRSLPLAGVPVAIKDDTDVVGQSTRWGSDVDRGPSDHDAEIVSRLRRAGAVIIGKTNVPELTLWPWTASEAFGITRNPWDPDRTPGGSSGGTAVAVSTGMAAFGLGSDGGGSIRYPAGLAGLVGLKPQRDRVPLGGEHASGWHGLVVLGPLTRSVRDAACFLDIASAEQPITTFRDAVDEPSSRLRVAVSTDPPPGTRVRLSSARRRWVDDAARLLADLGHVVIELEVDYGLGSLWNATVRLLKGVQSDVASLSDPNGLEARTRAVARLGRALPDTSLRRALEREAHVADSINRVFDRADVVLTPLCGAPAPRIADCPANGAMRSLLAANTSAWLVPWNVTGQPALTVPLGTDDDGLPASIHLAGRPGDEATLLGLAAQIETARPFPRWSPQPRESRATQRRR
jgi:amidase